MYISSYFTDVGGSSLKNHKMQLGLQRSSHPPSHPKQGQCWVQTGFLRALHSLFSKPPMKTSHVGNLLQYSAVFQQFFPLRFYIAGSSPVSTQDHCVSWPSTVHLSKDLGSAILFSLQAMEGCCQVSSAKPRFLSFSQGKWCRLLTSFAVSTCPSLLMSFGHWGAHMDQEFLEEIPNLISFCYWYLPFWAPVSRHKVWEDLVKDQRKEKGLSPSALNISAVTRSPAPLSKRSVFLVYFAINIEVEVLLFYYHPSMAKRFFYISLLPVLEIYKNSCM